MSPPLPPPPPPAPGPSGRRAFPWLGTGLTAGDRAVPSRLRWTLYAAFSLLGAVLTWQSTRALEVASAHAVGAEQRMAVAQQQVRLYWLARALDRMQADPSDMFAPRTVDSVVAQIEAARSEMDRVQPASASASAALTGWDAAWRDTRRALTPLLTAPPLASDAASAQAHADVLHVRAHVAAAQSRALMEQAGALEAAWRSQSRERDAALALDTKAGLLATLALLAGLVLLVVEPSVRSVRRQLAHVAAQARHVRMLALVAQHTDAIVMITDAQDRIVWANDAFSERTGWSLDEALGRSPGALIYHPDIAPGAVTALRDAVREGHGVRVECLNRCRDGRELWLDWDLQPLRDEQGVLSGFVSVNHDITERRRMQAQLQRHAQTDTLTGLPNRAEVMQRLRRAVLHAARHPGYGFAVLFMDLDRFKQVNDTLGHAAGDALLRQVAERLQQALRPGDALARVESGVQTAARLGGDEFVVVLEGMGDALSTGHVADRLLQVLTQPYQVGAHTVASTASIGIVLGGTQSPGSDARASNADNMQPLTEALAEAQAEALLRDADTAMYEAKRTRRGGWVLFDPSMQERVMHTLRVEQDLRRALKDGQLFVVYQPEVALPGRKLLAVEALVRWRHPERGVVPPAEFIAIAEECGLIGDIGDFVLRTACAQLAQWQRTLGALAPERVSVNLSRAQLREPGLVPEVRWALEQAGLPPGQLQLEVTESLAAQGAHVQATLRELKAMGVGLALDDFGTGYSSLACLDQLPVDTVKIDRSFVAHAQEVEYRRVLIEATVRVARTLGMATVAEGIETEAQAQQMAALGCDLGQGYHFSPPLEAQALAAWVLTAAGEAPADAERPALVAG